MSMYEIRLSYATQPSNGALRKHVPIRDSRDVVVLMAPLLEPEVVEVCYVLCVTVPLTLIGYHQVSRGSLGETLIHPREVFKVAVLANAAGVVLVHNHPSGNPNPSAVDHAVTTRVKMAGEVIGIELLDHIIIGHHGLFVSMKERGRL